jgi:hypothetical protein
MEVKKRGRPRSRDTIFLECPICHTSKIRSFGEYKLKGSIKWEANIKPKKKIIKEPQPQILEKKSLIINLMN